MTILIAILITILARTGHSVYDTAMTYRIFIDGGAGTTGLQVHDRLAAHPLVEPVLLDDARRKDAALRHVIISEKRDKKAAAFTTAGVPFPFTNREQFERSLRAPIGREWNTTASHKAMTAPSTTIVKGAIINPIPMHFKAPEGRG